MLKRFIGFAGVSALSFGLSFGLTVLLHEWFSLEETVAYAITLGAVFAFNFYMMRYRLYRDQLTPGEGRRQFVRCIMVSICFRALEWSAFYLLVEKAQIYYLISLPVVMVISFVLKFFAYDRLVFGVRSASDESTGITST